MTIPTTPVFLFSYGTLQEKHVQIANFGRELIGRADALPGYAQRLVAIEDPQVVATSGKKLTTPSSSLDRVPMTRSWERFSKSPQVN